MFFESFGAILAKNGKKIFFLLAGLFIFLTVSTVILVIRSRSQLTDKNFEYATVAIVGTAAVAAGVALFGGIIATLKHKNSLTAYERRWHEEAGEPFVPRGVAPDSATITPTEIPLRSAAPIYTIDSVVPPAIDEAAAIPRSITTTPIPPIPTIPSTQTTMVA